MGKLLRWSMLGLAIVVTTSFAQTPKVAPVDGKKVVAVANGREINEAAVQRFLKALPEEKKAKARPEVINMLVENALIAYYLDALKVEVPNKEIDDQLTEVKKEAAAQKEKFEDVLVQMGFTETEFKGELRNSMRWERFVKEQASDEKLKALFSSSPEFFDGTKVAARHILVTPDAKEGEKGKQDANKKALQIIAGIKEQYAKAVEKIPADPNPLVTEKAKHKAMEETFINYAKAHSDCPSKRDGGNLGDFPRLDAMVEPFAKTAFAQKPFELGQLVETQFGYHIILVTDRKPGAKVEFEKVKPVVMYVYGTRLREAVVDTVKKAPTTKIEFK